MEKRCTTCHYFQFAYPKRYCAHPWHHKEIFDTYRCCEDYKNYVEKELMPIPKKIPIEQTLQKIEIESIY